MNLLYLGPLSTLHAQNFISVFNDMGYNVTIINTSFPIIFPKKIEMLKRLGLQGHFDIYNLYEDMKSPFRSTYLAGDIHRVFFLNLIHSNKLRIKIGEILQEKQIDLIFSYWGSGLFPEIKVIQRDFDVPIVHNFETYPVSRFPWGARLENFYCGRAIERLEGRIHATQIMLSYMKERFNLNYGKDLVFMKWFSKRYFYRVRLPKLSDENDEPHIVFIGNTNFKSKLMDVLPQIKRIARKKIHIHIQKTDNPINLKSRFVHMFEEFNPLKLVDGSLATFMTQFDACIVLYNLKEIHCPDRFCNSTPSRFQFALTAGIPIILPDGYYKGCQRIISKYEIGSTYRNYEELKTKLYNEELIAYYQKNAVKKSHIFTFENNSEKLNKFMKDIANT